MDSEIKAPVIDSSSHFYLHASDHPGQNLVSAPFKEGDSFDAWRMSILNSLTARNKLAFIDGSCTEPAPDSQFLGIWKRCTSMVKAWLLNSLDKEIGTSVMYAGNAKDVWDELVQRFTVCNKARAFQIRQEMRALKQGNISIQAYFTQSKRLWDEYGAVDAMPLCKCGKCICKPQINEQLRTFINEQRILDFILGLNESYLHVRGNILMRSPLPPLGEIYSILIQEEQQRQSGNDPVRPITLVSVDENTYVRPVYPSVKPPDSQKSNLVCNYCKKIGHTKDKCYRIIGYPTHFQFSNRGGLGARGGHYKCDFGMRPPPFGSLPRDLREVFCRGMHIKDGRYRTPPLLSGYFPPDFVFYVDGQPIEAHRVMLSARSPYFKHKFETDWKDLRYFRYRNELSYKTLTTLIHFFYSDSAFIFLDYLEDLATICTLFKCESLRKIVDQEQNNRHKYEKDFQDWIEKDSHSTPEEDRKNRREELESDRENFGCLQAYLDGSDLPEEDRLPAALYRVLQFSLANSLITTENVHDLADICVKVDQRIFRCHQVVLAARSEYFRMRIFHMHNSQQKDDFHLDALPCLEEHDLSPLVFEKMLEYMYTDGLKDIDPKQAEKLLDAASRYLLFSLKRAVAEVLLPHLKMASPVELCDWLLLADEYGVLKVREYCLVTIACHFQTFADTCEFRAKLLTLRTTAPGAGGNSDQGNILDDLREKWLQVECAKFDRNNENALFFDQQLQSLMELAEEEQEYSKSMVNY